MGLVDDGATLPSGDHQAVADWNWWLPPFLCWLPHVTIEVEGLELEPEVR